MAAASSASMAATSAVTSGTSAPALTAVFSIAVAAWPNAPGSTMPSSRRKASAFSLASRCSSGVRAVASSRRISLSVPGVSAISAGPGQLGQIGNAQPGQRHQQPPVPGDVGAQPRAARPLELVEKPGQPRRHRLPGRRIGQYQPSLDLVEDIP